MQPSADDATWSAATGAELDFAIVFEDVKYPRDKRGRFRRRFVTVLDLRSDDGQSD